MMSVTMTVFAQNNDIGFDDVSRGRVLLYSVEGLLQTQNNVMFNLISSFSTLTRLSTCLQRLQPYYALELQGLQHPDSPSS